MVSASLIRSKAKKDISVIIVSWNTKDLLRQCLFSVAAAVKQYEHEIYVVDNASNDGSADMVQSEFPKVKLISNSSNLGFAAANNQSLRMANAKYALLLNPDTILSQECLMQLYTFAEQNPKCGVVGPKLLNADGSPQGWGGGSFPTKRTLFNDAYFLSRLFPRSRFFKGHALINCDSLRPVEIDWVAATCALFRREALEEVGLFNEAIFMYGEDVELCWRLKQVGWKAYYHLHATTVHYGSQSTFKQSNSFLRTKPTGWSVSSGSKAGYGFTERIIIISGLFFRLFIYFILYIIKQQPAEKQKFQLLWKIILRQ